MSELISYILLILLMGHFIVILFKNGFSVKDTFAWYKTKLFGENVTKNLKTGAVSTTTVNPPKNFKGNDLPFNLFTINKSNPKEIELRDKLIEKVQTRPSYYVQNGEKKLIVPLEALVFLNNDLNPLVNEYGELIIRIKEEKAGAVEGCKIYMEGTDEVLFENNEEILSSLKELNALMSTTGISADEVNDMLRSKIKERGAVEDTDFIPDHIKERIKDPEPEVKESVVNRTETRASVQDLAAGLADLEKELEEVPEEKPSAPKPPKKPKPKKELAPEPEEPEIDIAEMLSEDELADLQKEESVEEDNFNVPEIDDDLELFMEDSPREDKTAEKQEESVLEMLKGKEWQEIEGIVFLPRDFSKFFKETFPSEDEKIKLLKNIIKHKYLIFNDNKTAVYVDNIILYSSFSKLFGNDSSIIFNKFAKIKGTIQKSFESNFIPLMDKSISRKFGKYQFTDGQKCHSGFGLWLTVESLKPAFENDEEFDFFRSYQVNDFSPAPQESGCDSRLIPSIDNIYI